MTMCIGGIETVSLIWHSDSRVKSIIFMNHLPVSNLGGVSQN